MLTTRRSHEFSTPAAFHTARRILFLSCINDSMGTSTARAPAHECGHVQGGGAHVGGVIFPTNEAWLDRSLLVGNISPNVNTDQVLCTSKRCVAFCMLTCVVHCVLEVYCLRLAWSTALLHCLQLKQLFGFCGTVKDCRFEGIARTYAFVEMTTEEVRI